MQIDNVRTNCKFFIAILSSTSSWFDKNIFSIFDQGQFETKTTPYFFTWRKDVRRFWLSHNEIYNLKCWIHLFLSSVFSFFLKTFFKYTWSGLISKACLLGTYIPVLNEFPLDVSFPTAESYFFLFLSHISTSETF